MNSATYMTGVGADDTLPSNNQGMGRMDLGRAFDGSAAACSLIKRRRSARPGRPFKSPAPSLRLRKPFRVTLAWTDAPGPTTGAPYVNNLDLEVTVSGADLPGQRLLRRELDDRRRGRPEEQRRVGFSACGNIGQLHGDRESDEHRRRRRAR